MAATIDVATGIAGTLQRATREGSNVRVRGAALWVMTGTCLLGDVWAEIGLMADVNIPESKNVILAAGYINEVNPLMWEGDIGIDMTGGYYIEYRSNTSVTVRAVFETDEG